MVVDLVIWAVATLWVKACPALNELLLRLKAFLCVAKLGYTVKVYPLDFVKAIQVSHVLKIVRWQTVPLVSGSGGLSVGRHAGSELY